MIAGDLTKVSPMDTGPSDDIVRKEVAELSACRALQRSPQLQRMLAYLVEEALAGRGDRIKAFNIAVDVFGRKNSFDASTDPIVRVQAGRLRSALEHHYANEGRHSAIRIELPKGGYVPTFTVRALEDDSNLVEPAADPGPADPQPGGDVGGGDDTGWEMFPTPFRLFAAAVSLIAFLAYFSSAIPTASHQQAASVYRLMLVPFENSLDRTGVQHVASGLEAELATSLTRLSLVQLHLAAKDLTGQPELILQAARQANAHWVVTGSLHRVETIQKLNVYLLESTTGSVVWSQSYQIDDKATSDLVDSIIFDFRPRLFAAAKRAIERKPAPDPLDLFVLATWSPGSETNTEAWQRQRIDLARRAIAADKAFGPAHSVLADKLSLLANIDPRFDTPAIRAEASESAREALLRAPNDPGVVFNLALYNLHTGRLDQAAKFVQRTLELTPRQTLPVFWKDVLPYFCEPAPKAVIDNLALFDRRLSPENPVRWQTQLWLARLHFNAGDYDAALDAAGNSMRITPNLYANLIKLTSLVALGRKEEVPALYQEIKKYWPSFSFKHHNDVYLTRACGASGRHDYLLAVYRDAAKAAGAAP